MATKRITVETLWKLERPAQPTLSPDGAQACVSVSTSDMQENRSQSSLWLYSAFGGEPRRLTTAGEKDAEPRWSPDGRWIAFVAKRAGKPERAVDNLLRLNGVVMHRGDGIHFCHLHQCV